MTMANRDSGALLERLPPVRGQLRSNVPMSTLTWFKVGGPAEVLFRPADEAALMDFLQNCPTDIPIALIGAGSNLLVRDGGIPGVVIRLSSGFAGVRFGAEDRVEAGGMAMDINIARAAANEGLAELEFLRGIPGSLGGAVRMNAGAYGREIKDVLVSIRAVDRAGQLHRLEAGDLGLSYRHSELPADWIVVDATLQGRRGDKGEILSRMTGITDAREDTQPVRERTGGSTFKNPPGAPAWQLIDAAGCRGLRRGGAMVSEQHCNFLINAGRATARDLEELGEEVRRQVEAHSGIVLEWEIRRLGEYRDDSLEVIA